MIELITVIAIVGLLVSMILPAIMHARNRSRHIECANRLRQIGLAEHAYLESNAAFPTSRQPFPSTLTGLQRLTSLLKSNQAAFACPADRRAAEVTEGGPQSYYQNDGIRFRNFDRTGFSSDRDSQLQPGVFHDTTPADISDGLSNTAAVSEQLIAASDDAFLTESQLRADPQRYFWYTSQVYPTEEALAVACAADRQSPYPFSFATSMSSRLGYDHILPPNHVGCLNGPFSPHFVNDRHAALPASSQHGGYVNVLIADGAVRSVADHVDLKVWRALGTRAGAETASME